LAERSAAPLSVALSALVARAKMTSAKLLFPFNESVVVLARIAKSKFQRFDNSKINRLRIFRRFLKIIENDCLAREANRLFLEYADGEL